MNASPIVLVYTDGACSGNPGPAGLGVVMRYAGNQRELSEYLGFATNNIAELTAIARALDAVADKTNRIELYTDSQYAIGVLTKNWKAKANRELILDIKQRLAVFTSIKLHYVRAHNGDPLNERADELAVRAVRSQTTTGWTQTSTE